MSDVMFSKKRSYMDSSLIKLEKLRAIKLAMAKRRKKIVIKTQYRQNRQDSI